MKAVTPALALLPALLAGCAASMSGIGGSERLACKAPEGVLCTSVSGVYANAAQLASRSTPHKDLISSAATPTPYGARAASVTTRDASETRSDSVLRSAPKVLRVWIAPWQDSDGDLHEESTVHVLADQGRWLIEYVREQAKRHLDAVTPPRANPGETSKPAAAQPAPTLPALPGTAPVTPAPHN